MRLRWTFARAMVQRTATALMLGVKVKPTPPGQG